MTPSPSCLTRATGRRRRSWWPNTGITANAQIAEAAIPQCNLTLLTGEEMQDTVQAYYEVLYRADPAAIGGSIPYDSLYYLP